MRLGWTTKVDTRARCCDGGRKAGIGGSSPVPAVRRDIRRLSAGISERIRRHKSIFM